MGAEKRILTAKFALLSGSVHGIVPDYRRIDGHREQGEWGDSVDGFWRFWVKTWSWHRAGADDRMLYAGLGGGRARRDTDH